MDLPQEEYRVLIINPHKVSVYATVHYSLKGHHTELQAGRAEVPPGGTAYAWPHVVQGSVSSTIVKKR